MVRIERARPDDAIVLAACIDAAYAKYRAQGMNLPPVSDGVADDIQHNHVWVARLDGRVCGGLILVLDSAKAYLRNVAVLPEYGGQGIARRLIETAVRAARKAGCQVMCLTTHRGMPDNVALYRHLGWDVVGSEGDRVFMEQDLAAN